MYVRMLSRFACGSSMREYVSCPVACTCVGCFLKNEFNLHSWLRAIYCSRSSANITIVCCREALKLLRENGCSRADEHCVRVGLAVIFSSLCLAYWGEWKNVFVVSCFPPPPFFFGVKKLNKSRSLDSVLHTYSSVRGNLPFFTLNIAIN